MTNNHYSIITKSQVILTFITQKSIIFILILLLNISLARLCEREKKKLFSTPKMFPSKIIYVKGTGENVRIKAVANDLTYCF